jgi:hypothetical protein
MAEEIKAGCARPTGARSEKNQTRKKKHLNNHR